MQSESQETQRRRVGDPHPADDSLFFLRHKRGREVWVSKERLDSVRKMGNEHSKRRQQTEEYKAWRRKYCNEKYRRPEIKAKIAAKAGSPHVLARRREKYRSDPTVYAKIKEYRKQPHVKEAQRKSLAKWRATTGKDYKKKYYDLCKQNPAFRIMVNCRSRVYDALRNTGVKKNSKTKDLLGCTFEFFRGWIESKFERGMSWANYGVFWEIDHVRPCSSFLLEEESERLACFHYTNCQPLWKDLNNIKSDKIPGELFRGRELRKTQN